jgi:hypothetical protein
VREYLNFDLVGRPALRDIDVGNFFFVPLLGDIQVAVTTAVFFNIRYAVDTGADNVAVVVPVA